MKLPLHVHWDWYGHHQVIDAVGRIICTVSDRPEDRKFVVDLVRRFNRDWRWVLFGRQPYVYTREDWLLEKSKA